MRCSAQEKKTAPMAVAIPSAQPIIYGHCNPQRTANHWLKTAAGPPCSNGARIICALLAILCASFEPSVCTEQAAELPNGGLNQPAHVRRWSATV